MISDEAEIESMKTEEQEYLKAYMHMRNQSQKTVQVLLKSHFSASKTPLEPIPYNLDVFSLNSERDILKSAF